MIDTSVRYRLLSTFDDVNLTGGQWNDLVNQSNETAVFMTWYWQKAWWETFGRGKLLIIVAQREEKLIAIAPLFSEHGMVYFIGSGGSDYLDFIGNLNGTEILEGFLRKAVECTPDFIGFCFYHVPEQSSLSNNLKELSQGMGWKISNEGGMPAPFLSLKDCPEEALQATRKKSLLRHEAHFVREGGIEIEHLTQSEEILPHLNEFFDQHIARWAVTPYPSLFLDPKQRLFYKKLSEMATEAKYIRFTRVLWQGKMIACHWGVNYQGSFLWYKPSFDINLARYSPGEVLLRQLILRSLHEQAHTFDFGLGDEFFKKRFATGIRHVYSWSMNPSELIQERRRV